MMDNDRIPPHDIPAEVSVLGAMLIDYGAIPIAREILIESDFYRPAHQQIFKIICWMFDHPAKWGRPDLVTVRAAAAERGKLESLGGVEYLQALVEGVPSSANVRYYAHVVKDHAKRRAIIMAAHDSIGAAYEGGDAGEVLQAAAQAIAAIGAGRHARSQSSADDVADSIEAAIAGRRVSVPWPWPCLTNYAKACAPGAVSVLCGDPGSGKSFLFQEAMLSWHEAGIRTAMLHLEKDCRYHQTRALGQLAQNHDILSDEWKRRHPDEARDILAQHRETLDNYGACVWDDPDGAISLDGVQAWISARISDGARIVGVDPITAAHAGERSWDADRRFVVACESQAARAGCSIVLVTHPRGASGGAPGIDSLAGGRAYGRLTDCVLWLQHHCPPAESYCVTKFGPDPYPTHHNRTLTLCKTRDGTGQGMRFALQFTPQSLSTAELGLIDPKKRRQRRDDDE